MKLVLATILGLVLALGTLTAIGFVTANPDARYVYNLEADTGQYDRRALQLSSTGDLRAVSPSQPPGFISFLALIYAVFGHSYLAAKLAFCGLLLFTAILVAAVGWRLAGPLEGTIAATLTIASPTFLAYAATLQYEVLAAAVSMLVVALAVWPLPDRAPAWLVVGRAALLGLLCAAAALVREVLVLLVPLVAVELWRQSQSLQQRRAVSVVAVVLVAFAIPIGAWTLVQRRLTGELVFLSQKSAHNLNIGNNPNATGAYHLQLRPMREPMGRPFIVTHPADTARLAIRKVGYFWGLIRDPWQIPQPAAGVVSRAAFNLVPYEWLLQGMRLSLVGLFAGGMLTVILRRSPLWLAAASVIAVMALHVLYFSSPRFAVPVLPQIFLVAAVAAGAVVRLAIRHRRVVLPIGLAIAMVGVAGQFVRTPGTYRAEAESLIGVAADNAHDPNASGGMARVAPAGGRSRAMAYMPAELVPRGVFGVRAWARARDCARPDAPALALAVRDMRGERLYGTTVPAGTLCGSGYTPASLIGILRQDSIVSISVEDVGSGELSVDRLEVLFGYGEIRQVRRALE